jgi:glycogen operon protein
VTAHDGFTLADLTSYNDKHNEANGEDNNDGEANNRSWNCGTEGESDDLEVLRLRERQRRNLLGTLLLSAGVPMILGGDELGRTQDGNNNAYCQDNRLSWHDWEHGDESLRAFTKTALALRREYPALRPTAYLRTDESLPQMVLYAPDGSQMEDWETSTNALTIALDGRVIEDEEGDIRPDRFLLLLNAHHESIDFTIPPVASAWHAVLTSSELDNSPEATPDRTVTLESRSLLLLHSN